MNNIVGAPIKIERKDSTTLLPSFFPSYELSFVKVKQKNGWDKKQWK